MELNTQTPEERRRIRYEYRSLIDELDKNRQDLVRPEDHGLLEALDRGEELFGQVKGTREAVLDSHFLVVASALGSEQAQRLQTDFRSFDPQVFVEKMLRFLSARCIGDDGQGQSSEDEDEEEADRENRIKTIDWGKLSPYTTCIFRKTPSADFMYGLLDMEPPKRAPPKPPKSAQTDANATKITPTQVDRVETREEATTKEVERIHNILQELTLPDDDDDDVPVPISLFKFAINPYSFGQTVENFFHISFLTQKGSAEIRLDEDGLPVIVPCNPNQETVRGRVLIKKQNLVSLSMLEWKEIVKTFKITRPLIPTRPSTGTATNGHNTSGSDVDMNEDEQR